MKCEMFICGFLLLLLLGACSSIEEEGPAQKFDPDMVLSVAERSISVWDLVGESVPQKSDSVGEMHVTLQYLQEKALTLPAITLYNITTDTLLYAPHFNIKETDILTAPVTYTRYDTIELKSISKDIKMKWQEDIADFEYFLPYTGFDYNAEILFQNVYTEGTAEPMVLRESVTRYNQNGVRRKITSTFKVDLSKGNSIKMVTKVILPKGASLAEPQTISLLLKSLNIRLKKAVGYFPVPPLQLDSSNLKMNLNVLHDLSNAFDLTDPKYYLLVRNKGFGMPVLVDDLKLIAKNIEGSKNVVLESKNKPCFEANTENDVRVDTFLYNSQNSNLLEFLDLPPYGNVNYKGTILFNPEGNTGVDNVIYVDGAAQVDSYIEVPMTMKGSSLLYTDTLPNLNITSKHLSAAELIVSTVMDFSFKQTLKFVEFFNDKGISLGKIEFNQQLVSGKSLSGMLRTGLVNELKNVKYGIVLIEINPTQDILSIRQNASLKMTYSILGETKLNTEKDE